jgi:hypothetical protein
MAARKSERIVRCPVVKNEAARQPDWKPVLGMLAEKFTLARLALNSLSERYLKAHRARYFRFPTEN